MYFAFFANASFTEGSVLPGFVPGSSVFLQNDNIVFIASTRQSTVIRKKHPPPFIERFSFRNLQ